MAYPERKPIYDAYKVIIDKIIAEKHYQVYAESEIDALDQALLSAFKDIRRSHMQNIEWPTEKQPFGC